MGKTAEIGSPGQKKEWKGTTFLHRLAALWEKRHCPRPVRCGFFESYRAAPRPVRPLPVLPLSHHWPSQRAAPCHNGLEHAATGDARCGCAKRLRPLLLWRGCFGGGAFGKCSEGVPNENWISRGVGESTSPYHR
eukprot:gene18462-biopygen5423